MKENAITKEHQVVMLTTDNATSLFTIKNGELFNYYKPQQGDGTNAINQHLYFISDEPIKEVGIYAIFKNKLFKSKRLLVDGVMFETLDGSKEYGFSLDTYKKVIATSNPDLWVTNRKDNEYITTAIAGVPKIGISFLEAYVKEQGKIDKVLLEYEQMVYPKGDKPNFLQLKLKANSPVIVHPVKEKMYSREEVIRLLDKSFDDLMNEVGNDFEYNGCGELIALVKQHL